MQEEEHSSVEMFGVPYCVENSIISAIGPHAPCCHSRMRRAFPFGRQWHVLHWPVTQFHPSTYHPAACSSLRELLVLPPSYISRGTDLGSPTGRRSR